jgi:acyl-CoA reductase-like NAD-dependent aldehyde dehydrogenase
MQPTTKTTAVAGRKVWSAFVAEAFVEVGSAATFAVHNPATGQELAHVVFADATLVDRAVRDSRSAYHHTWRHLPPRELGAAAGRRADSCPR